MQSLATMMAVDEAGFVLSPRDGEGPASCGSAAKDNGGAQCFSNMASYLPGARGWGFSCAFAYGVSS